MNRKWRRTTLVLMSAGLAAALMAAPLAAAEGKSGSNASYSSWTDFSTWNKVPIAKPIWTADIGQPNADVYDYPDVTAAGSTILYVKQGVLHARNAVSGKTLWTYGKKLQPNTILSSGNYTYVYDEGGAIYRVQLKSGKGELFYQLTDAAGKKSKTISDISLSTQDNALYAVSTGTMVSIRLTDGKINWRNDELELPSAPERIGDALLFYSVESGAIMVGTTYAIDPSTGKQKWRLQGSHSELLDAQGGELYFQDQWPDPDGGSSVKIDVASQATGEIVRTLSYPALQSNHTSSVLFDKIAIDGDNLYIGLNGIGVYRYSLNADPAIAKPALLSDNGSWLAGPYDGKLFFADSDKLGLHARKIFDTKQVNYEGVNNPISRLDIIDSGMYVGQTDGTIYALNVTNGKALFRYEIGARNYGPFQTAGSMLLVQAEGKLYGFSLPTELSKPISNEASVANSFTKAQAKLTIDGVERAFEPSMMSSANRMFVPFRSLTEAVGATIVYDKESKQATVTYKERKFTIAEGKTYALVEEGQLELSYPPVILNGSLYVPVKDFADLLGIKAVWNASSRTVEISTK
ncbi:stalk domain-containing protein [Paenibacillus xylaniclasticus]|uniref:stalk domain-containing protein n=1 Tax=Paenibacillus xylaniclasticus TaxID=588083 RepID=UPI000FDCD7B3|nr:MULTISPECIES: stalk domain-containing protein [Paenibacillus]GFN31698.1 hypothetical protein PCURB6_19580 [Paenibacillus curdlanolyticus]